MKREDINKRKAWRSSIMMAIVVFIFMFGSGIEAEAVVPQAVEVDTNVFMREAIELQEVIVNPVKGKYSSKNNPAVDLMKRIRGNQKKGEPRAADKYSYDQYDKTTLGLLDITDDVLEKQAFLREYLDTTAYGRRRVLDVLLTEKASTTLFSDGKKEGKTVVIGSSSKGVSEMFDMGAVEAVAEDLMREVDIFEDDITLMSNKFVSPLSSQGTMHYKYFITDTLDVAGMRCIQLTFIPHTAGEFVFSGNIYVELGDTTGFVKRVSMKVPRYVNLNFVDNLHIDQEYIKDEKGNRHKVSDRISVDISLMPGTQRLYASRSSRYENFNYSRRKDFEKIYGMAGRIFDIETIADASGDFLAEIRNESLSEAESNMDSFMSDMRKYPLFYYSEKVLSLLFKGYVKTGHQSKFDFGPLNTFVSFNPIEKVRFRLGGMTTSNLSPHWFARGYVAYGIRDRKWKYQGEIEYSFNKKKYHSREFPINSLRLSHKYDIDMIGQHYLFTNPDNIFLSLKREKDMLATYCRHTRLEYNLELANQFSFGVWGEHKNQQPTQWLTFEDGYGKKSDHISSTSFGVTMRYAPGEKYIQQKSVRYPVNQDAPVMLLNLEWGPRGLPGMDFNLVRTELSIWKRFWFSTFGYLDALVKGGAVWSQVPYTELLWQNANLSYTIQPESYSLMNPMEFAMDRYASLDVAYWGNGVIFNRIPLIKKLKLREVTEFKCLWGTLTDRNDPELNPDLLRFPADANTVKMGKAPYMEISAGIDNIFKMLRIDYVWRLSYLEEPGISKSGIRIALHFKL